MREISTAFPSEGDVSGLGSIICTESGDGSFRIHSPDQKSEFGGGFSSHVSWAAGTGCSQRRLYPVMEGSI